MSLATTCPQCKTSFKVVPDQLKLRRGLVRCGMCRHVFSGVDFLRYLEDAPPGAPPMPARSSDAASVDRLARDTLAPDTLTRDTLRRDTLTRHTPTRDTPTLDSLAPDTLARDTLTRDTLTRDTLTRDTLTRDTLTPDPLAAGALSIGAPSGPTQGSAAEAARPPGTVTEPVAGPEDGGSFFDTRPGGPEHTLPLGGESTARTAPDFVVDEATIGSETAPIARTRPLPDREEPSLREPVAGPDDGVGEDAVDFFATSSRARGFSTRGTVFAAIASFVLAIALLLQLVIGSRDWLATRLPAARPVIAAAVAPLGLRVQPPRELDALTIESFELQSAGARNMLALNALLRNGADHVLRWPAMELSLTEAGGTVVVRKVLLPQDYLGAAQGELPGIGARAEWPVRVALRADGVEATGYSVKLFYP